MEWSSCGMSFAMAGMAVVYTILYPSHNDGELASTPKNGFQQVTHSPTAPQPWIILDPRIPEGGTSKIPVNPNFSLWAFAAWNGFRNEL